MIAEAERVKNAIKFLEARGFRVVAPTAEPARGTALRLPDVEAMTGLKKSTIYRLMRESNFPVCRKVGPRVSIWVRAEVLAWLDKTVSMTGKA